jgi:hypothetical protein
MIVVESAPSAVCGISHSTSTSRCTIDRSPLCFCGHRRSQHTNSDERILGDCAECTGCCGFKDQDSRPVETSRGWSRCTDLCNCGAEHQEGRAYFVSAIHRGEHRLLLGPFPNHGSSLEAVVSGRTLAERLDRRAGEYSFGTCSLPSATLEMGILDYRYIAPMTSLDHLRAADAVATSVVSS